MRLFCASVGILVITIGSTVSADKWIRGKVTAVGTDTVTVTFKGSDMRFTVNKQTRVVGEGLGTAQRQAGSLKLSETVPVGTSAEVHYIETGGAMRATEVRTGVTSGEAASTATPKEDSGESASGTVTALTGNSITIKSETGNVTFTVDRTTRVLARGAGTTAAKERAAGSGPTIGDLLKVGEDVTVFYHRTGSTRAAKEVRVRSPRP